MSLREVSSTASARALISSGVGIFSKFGPNSSISRTSLSAQASTLAHIRWRRYFNWHSSAMKTKGKENSFTLHSLISSHELNFGKGKGMTKMERSVHVGICHASEEFGVFLSHFFGCDICFRWRTIGFPNFLVFPDLLVFLFDCDRGIAFLCLS